MKPATGPVDARLLTRLRAAVDLTASARPPQGRRRASVLLLFDPADQDLPLLFILRAGNLRFHAGQIAFPGGSEDPADRDLIATALREAEEEVALAPDNVDVLGILPAFLTAVSDLWLTPVVGLERSPWVVATDPVEVAEWFRIDLATLITAPHTVRDIPRDGEHRDVHFYEVEGRVIWGVSGAILHELLTRLGRGS